MAGAAEQMPIEEDFADSVHQRTPDSLAAQYADELRWLGGQAAASEIETE